MDMELHVECYSGYRADERPLRFAFSTKPDAPKFTVKEVLDQWYGVGYQCFKVRTDGGNVYILRHDLIETNWSLDSFRRIKDNGAEGQATNGN
jgi:hypothetical protein